MRVEYAKGKNDIRVKQPSLVANSLKLVWRNRRQDNKFLIDFETINLDDAITKHNKRDFAYKLLDLGRYQTGDDHALSCMNSGTSFGAGWF